MPSPSRDLEAKIVQVLTAAHLSLRHTSARTQTLLQAAEQTAMAAHGIHRGRSAQP
jgi:hypothetical protein